MADDRDCGNAVTHIALEVECPRAQPWGCYHDCIECGGLGYMNTAQGEAILKFLSRRNFVIAKD